jgi:outer membrane protein OmpA-like peptidoglycan-associated protein
VTVRSRTLPLTPVLLAMNALLAACALTPRIADQPGVPSHTSLAPPADTVPLMQMQQLGFAGGALRWAACRIAAAGAQGCPAPTPKTLASSAAPPVPVAAAGPYPQDPIELAAAGARLQARVPAQSLQARLASSTAANARKAPLLTVQFAPASSQLTPSARAQLTEHLPALRDAGALRLLGRTDATGDVAANHKLANARVLAVLDWLHRPEQGVSARWTAHAQGSCCYVASNAEAEGRSANRRVEIYLTAMASVAATVPHNPDTSPSPHRQLPAAHADGAVAIAVPDRTALEEAER